MNKKLLLVGIGIVAGFFLKAKLVDKQPWKQAYITGASV